MAQGLVAEEAATGSDQQYRPVECVACNGIHLINPVTRRLLSEEHREE